MESLSFIRPRKSPMTFHTGRVMQITRLFLKGFHRIGLSGITSLDWTPESPYQIILGTNGSGKSSLMSELSPLPPTPSEYDKDGVKHIEMAHRGDIFILESKMGSSVRHSFQKNREELNTGGTSAIQLALVEQYFGYTKELHGLLTGKRGSRFSDMSQADRRKWVTRLSTADYRYAFGLFDRLKGAYRDREGALKHVKRKLADALESLNRLQVHEGLTEEVKTLQTQLTTLLYHRDPSARSMEEANGSLTDAIQGLTREGQAIQSSMKRAGFHQPWDELETVESQLEALLVDETASRSRIDSLQKEYDAIETIRRSLEAENVTDEGSAADRIAAKRSLAASLESQVIRFKGLLDESNPKGLVQSTDEILPRVMDLFSRLPDNSDGRFSKDNSERAHARLLTIQSKLDQAEQIIRSFTQRLHAIEHAHPETCPQCQYTWKPGVDPNEAQNLIDQREAQQLYCKKGEETREHVKKYLEEADAYMAQIRQWYGFVNQYPLLHRLWETIESEKRLTDRPSEQLEIFHDWQREVQACEKRKEALDDLERLLAIQRQAAQGGSVKLKERLVAIEETIKKETAAWHTARETRQRLGSLKALHESLDRSVAQWNSAMERLEKALDEAMASAIQQATQEAIETTQSMLGSKQHRLDESRILLGVSKNLTTQLDDLTLEHVALGVLVKELSPKEGFIAEQIRGFITCFVAQINSIIASVWSYGLEVLPCHDEDGTLDYRFPMRCGEDGLVVNDVTQGSTSQVDMVDFAFRQTVMLYLGLEGYPLFVDELGASFDEAHRPSVNQFVSRLMDTERYSQVFLISHYVAGWGSFANAEYLVLDSRNIAVPDPHNTHVTLH